MGRKVGQFPGFDGRNEAKFMAYARLLLTGGSVSLHLVSPDCNSRFPRTGRDSFMLKHLGACHDPHTLTTADIQRILG
jgi:uncharacterized protein YfbU (UPF0304 family)